MTDISELANRYVAVWNEPDPELRRQGVVGLWTADGVQKLEPPQDVRDAAAALVVNPIFESRGHDALEARVARAYEEFIAPGEFVFQRRDDAARVGDVVKFRWEMVRKENGETAAVGLEFLVLDGDGRIRLDYQFIES
jgi:hypothetical protein